MRFSSALLVSCAPLLFAAAAQTGWPAGLPPLQQEVQVQLPASQPTVRWQLHQQLYHSFQTGQGRLSFGPSLHVALHDPQAELRLHQEQASAELEALERRSEAQRAALSVHLSHVQLQNRNRAAAFLRDWLADWSALPAGPDQQAARAELQRSEVEGLLADISDQAWLLSLQLESQGFRPGPAAEHYLRPVIAAGEEPLLRCLQFSPTVRRIEVLNQLDLLSREHAAAGSQLRVDLELRADISMTQADEFQPGTAVNLNAGLRLSRADHSEPRLQFEVSDQGVSQSLTLRGPQAPAAVSRGGETDPEQAIDREALRLLSLLSALEQASRQESLDRASLALELDLLRAAGAATEPVRTDLYAILQPLVNLLQAELHHDQLALELAAECGFPLVYRDFGGLE